MRGAIGKSKGRSSCSPSSLARLIHTTDQASSIPQRLGDFSFSNLALQVHPPCTFRATCRAVVLRTALYIQAQHHFGSSAPSLFFIAVVILPPRIVLARGEIGNDAKVYSMDGHLVIPRKVEAVESRYQEYTPKRRKAFQKWRYANRRRPRLGKIKPSTSTFQMGQEAKYLQVTWLLCASQSQ